MQLLCFVQKIILQSVLLIGILYYTSVCISSSKNEISEQACGAYEVLLSLDTSLNCTYLILEIVGIFIVYEAKVFSNLIFAVKSRKIKAKLIYCVYKFFLTSPFSVSFSFSTFGFLLLYGL